MSATRHALPAVVRVPLQAAERIEWHYHDGSQLIYPGRGVLQVFTPAGSWIVPPLRGVWIPAGVPHSHRARGRTDLLSVAFDASVDPFGDERPAVVEISPLLREVVLALTADDPPAGTRTLLRRLLLDQLRRVAILPLALPRPRDDRLLPIVEQLSGDPSDRRTLAQFGHEVGASERTLSRLFRRETGMSFPQWRGQLRLQHAQLLLAGGESVTATAHACGYRSTSAFIEAFRTAFGSTPRRLIAGHARDQPLSLRRTDDRGRIVGAKSQLLGARGRVLGQLDGSGAPVPGAKGVDGVHATT